MQEMRAHAVICTTLHPISDDVVGGGGEITLFENRLVAVNFRWMRVCGYSPGAVRHAMGIDPAPSFGASCRINLRDGKDCTTKEQLEGIGAGCVTSFKDVTGQVLLISPTHTRYHDQRCKLLRRCTWSGETWSEY